MFILWLLFTAVENTVHEVMHRKRIKPIKDAEYYISVKMDKPGLESIFVNDYIGMLVRYSANFSNVTFVMVALCNRADHYIFALWFLSIVYLFLFLA